jgi:ubiquinone/menaquinone biosynthesis C-methylase UbiE
MGSDKDIQAWINLEKTDTGNVGADIVVNPTLYAEIVQKILSCPPPVVLADFGGGTASLALDILAKDPSAKPALAKIGSAIHKARKHIQAFYTVDMYDALLQQGEDQKQRYGMQASALHMVKTDLGVEKLPFSPEEIDVAVSRQFLMHLSRTELEHHLREVYRVLKSNRWYIASILNPTRDLARYKEKHPGAPALEPEQNYAYEMQHGGMQCTQRSTYRPLETYIDIAQNQGFALETTFLSASIHGYEKDYPSYYNTELPMAVLLLMKKP